MKAVILAAGYATRLAPYTRLYPKTLLRVGGRPLLDPTVEALAAAPGIDGLALVTNSRYAAFFDRWRARSAAARLRPISVVDDRTHSNEGRRGSVGDLLFAIDSLGLDDDLLVVCSDKLFDFSIPAFLAFARAKGGGANACQDVGDPALLAGRRGCLVLAPDGRIVEFLEKPARPPSSIESIAFYVLPRAVLPLIRDYARATPRPDAPGTMIEWLALRTPIYGWPIDGECLDVGDPASYREADRVFRARLQMKAAPAETLLDGRHAREADVLAALDRLEEEPSAAMVHLAVDAADLARAEAAVLAHPHLLPVDVLAAAGETPAALCGARGCRWYVRADSGADGRPAST